MSTEMYGDESLSNLGPNNLIKSHGIACLHCSCGVCVWTLFCNAVLSFDSNFAIISLMKRERASCFTLIMLLLSCGCCCSLSLHRGAVGWSVVCDCGISLSYSLKSFDIHFVMKHF